MVLRLLSFVMLSLLLGVGAKQAQGAESTAKDLKIEALEKQVALLKKSYALSREDAQEARKQLQDALARLEALGVNTLSNKDEQQVATIAQLEAQRVENQALRDGIFQLSQAARALFKVALVDDANVARNLEIALRQVEVLLGQRQAPRNPQSGTLTHSVVLSIDSESGLIVINAGKKAEIEVGMPMTIVRGDQVIANALVTDVRDSVSGLLVQEHLNPALKVSVGDRVSAQTND